MTWADISGLAFGCAMGLPFGGILGLFASGLDRLTGYRIVGPAVALSLVLAIGGTAKDGLPAKGEASIVLVIVTILTGALLAHAAVWLLLTRRNG